MSTESSSDSSRTTIITIAITIVLVILEGYLFTAGQSGWH